MPSNPAYLPRYFAMARHPSWNSGVGGWFVCDSLDLDKTNLAKSIHGLEPCESEQEAREIAAMMNEECDDPRE